MPTDETIVIESPFTPDKVTSLKLGQRAALRGSIVACRGKVLAALCDDGEWMRKAAGLALYHAAPLVIGCEGAWRVYSAGPSVSMRSEALLVTLVKRFNIHVVVGQGSMGAAMCRACAEQQCVYLQCVGLAGASLAKAAISVNHGNPGRSELDEDGPWRIEVDHMEAIVVIDARGRSLTQRVRRRAAQHLKSVLGDGK